MTQAQLVRHAAGLHGPPHLIAQIERDFESFLAAVDERLPVDDNRGPLVTVLLLAKILRLCAPGVRQWLRPLTNLRRRTPVPEPFLLAAHPDRELTPRR